jgi:hypothetical protein
MGLFLLFFGLFAQAAVLAAGFPPAFLRGGFFVFSRFHFFAPFFPQYSTKPALQMAGFWRKNGGSFRTSEVSPNFTKTPCNFPRAFWVCAKLRA